EALHKLELEGLIEPLETRGFCVPRGSRDEVEELFDLRAILEGYTLRLVCEAIDEETLAQLGGFVEKAEAALREQKSDEIFNWNTRFHDKLQSLVAHKGRLYSLIVNMRKYVLRYRKDTLHRLEAGKRTVDGHHRILLALRLGDADLCERVMRQHIQQAKEDALANLSAGQEAAS
ncbi:MAG: GntR family transcriptional regulator, partial [Desulfobacterales bacterium]|nr:GntR family transcriptional regulator [Desulfobacterales bacterium]